MVTSLNVILEPPWNFSISTGRFHQFPKPQVAFPARQNFLELARLIWLAELEAKSLSPPFPLKLVSVYHSHCLQCRLFLPVLSRRTWLAELLRLSYVCPSHLYSLPENCFMGSSNQVPTLRNCRRTLWGWLTVKWNSRCNSGLKNKEQEGENKTKQTKQTNKKNHPEMLKLVKEQNGSSQMVIRRLARFVQQRSIEVS